MSLGWVLSKLIENLRRASEAEPVLNAQGEVAGIVYQGSVVNRALELLGKHIGMFSERLKHEDTGKDGGAIRQEVGPAVELSKLSDEQLESLEEIVRVGGAEG